MAPYLEQANLFNALNFDFPMAYKPTGGPSPFWPFYPANTTAMATTVASFLCPSDGAPPPMAGSGPANYAFCSGSGSNGGDATGADGAFILGPAMSVAGLTDGSSQTAAASEQLLGIAGPYSQTTPDADPLAPLASDGPGRGGPPDRRGLCRGRRRLAAEQGGGLVGRQLPQHPLQPPPDAQLRPATTASPTTTPAGRPPAASIPAASTCSSATATSPSSGTASPHPPGGRSATRAGGEVVSFDAF